MHDRNTTKLNLQVFLRMDIWMFETCRRHSYNKTQLDALISQIYFWNKILRVSGSSSVHHQEFFTVHTAMIYVIQVCWQLASIGTELVPSWSCSQAVWHIPLLCVQCKTADGQRNCPKYVKFYSKNNFDKLVYLVGFIIRIYHDALSQERQMSKTIWLN